MKTPLRILIVEDEGLIALSLKLELTKAGYIVCAMTTHGEEAVILAKTLQPQVILLDIRLAGKLDGFGVASSLQASIPIIFLSAYLDETTRSQAAQFQPAACLTKPVAMYRLRAILDELSTQTEQTAV